MVFNSQITNELFNELIKCVEKKGGRISDVGFSKTSSLFNITLNGEIKRYINVFEAFHNLYVTYNCKRNLAHLLREKSEIKIIQNNENVVQDKETLSPEEKSLVHHLEVELFKDRMFVRFTDIERESIIFQIKMANTSQEGKKRIILKLIENIDDKYAQEINSLSSLNKINFNRNYERIRQFLKAYLNKF